ncbi:hypothetical protein ACT3S5_00575 [Halomonas sp. AOP31-B1-25]|uniref:hypothetical protein n=1 Tax=Halomonas sp. AOP31-B1-25 TaxID=3457694 RepID=UPI0040345A59
MNARTLSVAGLLVIVASMVLAANIDASSTERLHETYCTEVAVWAAEEARGVDPLKRTGHPDYRGIAEDACPGLRRAT